MLLHEAIRSASACVNHTQSHLSGEKSISGYEIGTDILNALNMDSFQGAKVLHRHLSQALPVLFI